MIGRLRRARRNDVAELNITAFMNLMVALVPFLLITAVFTQLAVKQLNLPDNSAATPEEPPVPGLELVVRQGSLTLMDGGRVQQHWPRTGDLYEFSAVTTALAEIKERRPAEDNISLLLEPGIPYDVLIHAMDAVHYLPAAQAGVQVDMFPRIAVGEAPPVEGAP
ncbi:biopolymer transporter ExbD [Flagellatimonas centrodinii]|uniref:ExbD/TolR family protein n=1 Tax=Flagellatimonas centrodinii TaxID=2806210 RepID=UPI001FEEEFF0|nr:biopolymer transporter ExbD [Flagellatimonas centrodinii]ULQ46927.1 biopolymer transporter ExbD [Flagellatimonas centrodinii]